MHNTGHNVPHRQLRSRKLNRSILTGQKAQSQCHFEAVKFTSVNSMLTHFYVIWQQSYSTLRCSGGHFGFCPPAANPQG